MRPLYIFDIDGTIANLEHRLHHIYFNASMHGLEKDFKKDWQAFHNDVGDDKPIWTVIDVLVDLSMLNDIWFFTGRMESCRADTVVWIEKYMPYFSKKNHINITMRPQNDYRPDYEIKKEMLDNMLAVDRNRLVAIFDDRNTVVNMWRKNGITCFQVADGEF